MSYLDLCLQRRFDRRGEAKLGDIVCRLAVNGQLGSNAANGRGELERVSCAQGDDDVLVAVQGGDDKLAVRRDGVLAGDGAQDLAAGVGHEVLHGGRELLEQLGRGLERALRRRHVVLGRVVGALDGRLAEARKPVVPLLAAEDPDGEAVGLELGRVAGLEVRDLLLHDRQWDLESQRRQELVDPRVRRQDDLGRRERAVGRFNRHARTP